MKSYNFVFTLNNYTDAHEEAIAALYASDACKYIKYGKEVGESGTPHLQGMIGFKSQRRTNAVIKLFPGAHIEIMKGRVDQSDAYVSKDGDCTVYGTLPMTSKAKGKKEKERWTKALSAAKSGNFDEIDDDIRVRYYSTIKRIYDDHRKDPEPISLLTNEWVWGPTGTGKSRSVAAKYPNAYYKLLNKWWDGYSDQDTVVIEDLDPFNCKLGGDIKRWADHRPFPAEYKGGVKVVRPKRIVITSNYHPSDIWSDPNTYDPILRRFHLTKMDNKKKRKRKESKEPQVSRPGSWAPGFTPPPLEPIELKSK